MKYLYNFFVLTSILTSFCLQASSNIDNFQKKSMLINHIIDTKKNIEKTLKSIDYLHDQQKQTIQTISAIDQRLYENQEELEFSAYEVSSPIPNEMKNNLHLEIQEIESENKNLIQEKNTFKNSLAKIEKNMSILTNKQKQQNHFLNNLESQYSLVNNVSHKEPYKLHVRSHFLSRITSLKTEKKIIDLENQTLKNKRNEINNQIFNNNFTKNYTLESIDSHDSDTTINYIPLSEKHKVNLDYELSDIKNKIELNYDKRNKLSLLENTYKKAVRDLIKPKENQSVFINDKVTTYNITTKPIVNNEEPMKCFHRKNLNPTAPRTFGSNIINRSPIAIDDQTMFSPVEQSSNIDDRI